MVKSTQSPLTYLLTYSAVTNQRENYNEGRGGQDLAKSKIVATVRQTTQLSLLGGSSSRLLGTESFVTRSRCHKQFFVA